MIAWLKSSWLNAWVNEVGWAWPLLEITHFMGLCLLFGALLVMDLRLLGFFRTLPLAMATRLAPLAATGLILNLASGLAFFIGNPTRYLVNPAFQWKMALVALAIANLLYFAVAGGGGLNTQTLSASGRLRVSAGLSILAWTGVIIAGRMIPFFE